METPQAFWMRVAMGLAIREHSEDKEKWAIRFYNILSNFDFMSSIDLIVFIGYLLGTLFLSVIFFSKKR